MIKMSRTVIPFGEKTKLTQSITKIKKLCKKRKNFKCVGMTDMLEKDLKKKGFLK